MTEPAYIRGYEQHVRNVTVQIEIPDAQGVPLTLVQTAVRLKDQAQREAKRTGDAFVAWDEVWCVFDVDDHPHLPDARQLARSHEVELAVSNPCFELWVLLHFRDSPGERHRDDVRRLLRGFLPTYDKHLRFDDLVAGVSQAHERARRMDADAARMDEAGRNPSTAVYRLTKSIARR